MLVDQRRLPDELVEVVCESAGDVAQAIREMVVRGAPALGQVAAAGLALAAGRAKSAKPYARRAILRGSSNALVNARPTAVSIRWATNRMLARYAALGELARRWAGGRAGAARGGRGDHRRGDGRPRRHGPPRRRAPARSPGSSAPAADPLQHGPPRLRPDRDGPRRRPGAGRGRTGGPRLCRRDAPLAPGGPAHGVGAGPGGHPVHAPGRRCRRLAPRLGSGRRDPGRSGPDRGERRHRQQGGHVPAGGARGAPRGALLRRRPHRHARRRGRSTAPRSRSRCGTPPR